MKNVTEMQLKERETEQLRSFPFVVTRPGGNDTALFIGVIDDAAERKELNDAIMALYPNVEQVGFVSLGTSPRLMMAGGEFCGNATRSTAWLSLRSNPGEVTMQVSGVEGTLQAGVSPTGEARSQMPIYKDKEKLQRDPTNPQNTIVAMEGITHLVTFDTSPIEGKTQEEIKAIAMDMLRERELDKGPAAGVMFASQNGDKWQMVPIVYVQSIDTLFYETACGSGTTALGLVLASQEGTSIQNVPIYQPSGLPINISVEYDGQEFTNASIQGPVEILAAGVLERNNDFDYVVEQALSQEQLDSMLEDGLIGLYQSVFSDPPYEEEFSEEEVREIFQEYFDKGLISIARGEQGIIGFAATIALREEAEIANLAEKAGIDTTSASYFAELGIDRNFRRRGLGEQMCKEQLRKLPSGSTVVLRTAADNFIAQSLYKKLGFQEVIGMKQQVTQKRLDGAEQTDERIFLQKTL